MDEQVIIVRCDRDDYNLLADRLRQVPNPLAKSVNDLLVKVVHAMREIIEDFDHHFENPRVRSLKTNLNLAVTQLNGLSIVKPKAFEEFDDDMPHFPNANNNGSDEQLNEEIEKIELNHTFDLKVPMDDYQVVLHYCLDNEQLFKDFLTLYLTNCAKQAQVIKSANPNQLLAGDKFSYVIGLDKPTVLNDDNNIDKFNTLKWFNAYHFDWGDPTAYTTSQLQKAFFDVIDDIQMHLQIANVSNVYANRRHQPDQLTGFDYVNIVNAHIVEHLDINASQTVPKSLLKFLLKTLCQFQVDEKYGNGDWLVFHFINQDQFQNDDTEKLRMLNPKDFRAFDSKLDGSFDERFVKLDGQLVKKTLLEVFSYRLAKDFMLYAKSSGVNIVDRLD